MRPRVAIALVGMLVCALVAAPASAAESWCEEPRRLGTHVDATVQEVERGSFASAVVLLSSANIHHHKTMKLVRELAAHAAKFGVPVVWADEEGPEAEKRFVHDHGEGPIPRVVVFHDAPRGYHSRPRLVSTELEAHGAEELARRVEDVVADLKVDPHHTPTCPHRRVKRGFPGVPPEEVAAQDRLLAERLARKPTPSAEQGAGDEEAGDIADL